MPNIFEMYEYEINRYVVCGFDAIFFSFYIKEKIVGPVKVWQDQYILGVTGPTRPVTV